MQGPIRSFARSVRIPGHFHEAVVEGEIVSQRVLPALRIVSVIREPISDEPVYLGQRQHPHRRAPYRHGSERYVRVGWLLIAVGIARRPRHVGQCERSNAAPPGVALAGGTCGVPALLATYAYYGK